MISAQKIEPRIFCRHTGSSRVIVPIGGRLSGFRTVSLKTCDPIEGFLWELNSDGSEALLESYNITGTTELCQVIETCSVKKIVVVRNRFFAHTSFCRTSLKLLGFPRCPLYLLLILLGSWR